MSSAELTWDGGAVMTRVWQIAGATIDLVHPLASDLPAVGTPVTISIRARSQLIRLPARVESAAETYGTFVRITCATHLERRPQLGRSERRANTRFGFSPLFPLFCFARQPADRRLIPLYTIDVSNGGISLGCVAPNAALLPSMRLECRFDAPSIGHFSATLIVQSVTQLPADHGATRLRICAEFLDLSEHAREIISLGLTRPNSSNPLGDLKRENLLCDGWDELVEFSATRVCDDAEWAPKHIRAEFIGRLGETVACRFTLSRNNGSAVEFNDWSFHPDLDEERLLRRVTDEITACATTFELQENEIASLVGSVRTSKPAIQNGSSVETTATRPSAGLRRATPNGAAPLRRKTAARKTRRNARPVQWGAYAQAYDVMSGANPAYQENLARFRSWIASFDLPAGATICDVGAGTGNYALEVSKRFPNTELIHLDSDPVMNRTASRKYRERGADNISFANAKVADVHLQPSSLDLIICVNALYTFGDTANVLKISRVVETDGATVSDRSRAPDGCRGLVALSRRQQCAKRRRSGDDHGVRQGPQGHQPESVDTSRTGRG